MRLKIEHTTTYDYESPVVSALQQVRLTPPTNESQTLHEWQTSIEGGASQLSYSDEHQNHVELVRVDEGAVQVLITTSGVVQTQDLGGVTPAHTGLAPLWLYKRETPLTSPGDAVRALAKHYDNVPVSIELLHGLSSRIRDDVAYAIGATTATVSAEESLVRRVGVCQDHAQIFVSAARLLGLPARYVSGYLMMNDRVDQDATHAWAEAWVDGLGWVGFDVSNGISPDSRYVRIATGLDYREAAPIRGVRRGQGHEELTVSLQVHQQ